jgi:hypothetical protein
MKKDSRAFPRMLNRTPRLSRIFLFEIRYVIPGVDRIVFAAIAFYALLNFLTYSPLISNRPVEVVNLMLWMRNGIGFDSVHYIAGSSSFQNSLAIARPIYEKLSDIFDWSVGGTFVKIALARGFLRLLEMHEPIIRISKPMSAKMSAWLARTLIS